VTAVLRGWLSRIFFLEGGLGVGWMQLDDPYGTIADTKGGLAILGGAGLEIVQAANFALDIRRLAARQSLPGYLLTVQRDARGIESLAFRPVPFAARAWVRNGG